MRRRKLNTRAWKTRNRGRPDSRLPTSAARCRRHDGSWINNMQTS